MIKPFLSRARTRWVRRAGALMLGFGAVVGSCTCAPPTSMWNTTPVPNPALPAPLSGVRSLTGASCPSADMCIAVGTLSAVWDGRAWTVHNPPPWHPQNLQPAGSTGEINADVSCASVESQCFAVVSRNRDSLGVWWGGLGGLWLRITGAQPDGVTLHDISCNPVLTCMATGTRTAEPGTTVAMSLTSPTLDAFDITAARWVDTGLGAPAGSTIHDLDCSTAQSCIAVGTVPGPAGDEPMARVWDGQTWTDRSPRNTVEGQLGLDAVSCPTPGSCRVIGHAGPAAAPHLLTLAGDRWTGTPLALPPGTALRSISCQSERECLTAGSSGTSTGMVRTRRPLLARLTDAGAEPLEVPAVGSIGSPPGNGAELGAVACPRRTAGRCVAGGHRVPQLDGVPQADGPYLLTVEGTTVRLGEGNPVAGGVPSSRLTDVSCVEPGWCLATGVASAMDGPRAITATWDGTRWTMAAGESSGISAGLLSGVSCQAPGDCLAAVQTASAGGGRWLLHRSDGTRWDPVTVPGLASAEGPVVPACAPDGCVVFAGGLIAVEPAAEENGADWRTRPGPTTFGARVACSSRTFCVGGGLPSSTSAVSVWDGQEVRVLDRSVTDALGTITDASCSPGGACVVVAARGSLRLEDPRGQAQVGLATGLRAVSCDARQRCSALGTVPAALHEGDGVTWQAIPQSTVKVATAPDEVPALSCWTLGCMHVGGTTSGPLAPQASSPAAERITR
jgi:hypothetical protein